MSDRPRPGPATWRLVAGLLLLLVGVLMWSDRPGLRRSFHALAADCQSRPVFSDIADPQLRSRRDVADVLVSQEFFSLCWRGWILVEEEGPYEFSVRVEESAVLSLDGRPTVAVEGSDRPLEARASLDLGRGAHRIEVRLNQTRGPSFLDLKWGRVGEGMSKVAGGQLVAQRPVWIRGAWRQLTRRVPAPWLRSIGVMVSLVGLALLTGARGSQGQSGQTAAASSFASLVGNRWVLSGALLTLFLATSWLAFPYTSATADGDDVRYMDGALFNKQMGWNMNRYAHIYLLKGFIEVAQGDVYLASRLQWSFMAGVTVAALAVAVAALGPAMELKSLLAVLFMLLAQPRLLGGIGAAYADYTAMMFVTLGLAVYMHGYATRPESSSRWHALALGALTIGAGKSKEPGAIMLWFLFLLLWSAGRIDLRRFVPRLLWWLGGALGAYLVLMILDGWVLGDFWFSLRPRSLAGAEKLLQAAEAKWQLSRFSWLSLPWGSAPLRALSVVAILAPISAWIWRRPVEMKLVSVTPLVFMAMMIAVHPPTLTPRYLFSIIPVTCFVGAMMLHDVGLSSASWRGGLSVRTLLILVFLVTLFGGGFVQTQSALARHTAFQRGELTLYPWRTFAEEIERARPKQIQVTHRLFRKHQMIGKKKTRERIARMYFGRRHLRLSEGQELQAGGQSMAIGDRSDFRRWRLQRPDLRRQAVFDPAGQIVLVQAD